MKRILLIICIVLSAIAGKAQGTVSGVVISSDEHTPLPGATIQIKSNNHTLTTDAGGAFKITLASFPETLAISFTGYQSKEIIVKKAGDSFSIELPRISNQLSEVVVSTGYQKIPKERATGSFVQVDNALLNRRVSTDILSRLEDITSGLIFNKDASVTGKNDISIRGRSTILANSSPLIVIDNFPYDGDINNINPNDVENITVLKDAAAASIWGARAGNGVIVIATKKGRYNKAPQVSFNSNVTVGAKPNQFYISKMSSADFIEVEKSLFSQGYYNDIETSPDNEPLTPVVEILIAARDGQISQADANAQIEALKKIDVRKDFDKYFNRKSVNQQYAFNIAGGGNNNNYILSTGYDKNLDNLVGNGYSRFTFNASNSYSLLNQKLELSAGVYFTRSTTAQNNPGTNSIVNSQGWLYPYASLADASGHPLAITKDYRNSFVQAASNAGLLDWSYKPLDEISLADNKTTLTDYRLNSAVSYKIIPQLSADIQFQYEHSLNDYRNLQSDQTYFTRDLINNFTVVNSDGSLTRNIPLGGILDFTNGTTDVYNVRGQLNYSQSWTTKHRIDAIGGYEIRDFHSFSNTSRLYGYDDEHAASRPVDYINYYPIYYYPGAVSTIPYTDMESDLTDHYRSYFANAAYTYNQRYIFSGSARIDESNLFGVKTNQKGVPLWSAGFAWNINKEAFYHVEWLPYLKLRLTYGYNGNVDKTVSAYTTGSYLTGAFNTGLPYVQINTAANPQLRWERVKVTNLGFDFATKNSAIEGSIEFYNKLGLDLLGNTALAPSTGITSFKENYANTKTNGMDITINTRNIDREFKWFTTFLVSLSKDKVTSYAETATGTSYVHFLGTPLTGRPLYGIYSYKWGGLDHNTGDPVGFLNGVQSENYSAIIAGANPQNLVFNGPARPPIFGSIRNSFAYGNFNISANISYRFGYYFRKPSVRYASILAGIGGNGDYDLRWQKPGDEQTTNVPSLPATGDTNRDNFYNFSEVLVEKGDNLRLQDVSLSYSLSKKQVTRLPVKKLQIYFYANNLGLIWKAAKGSLDPDYSLVIPPVKTISIGLKADL